MFVTASAIYYIGDIFGNNTISNFIANLLCYSFNAELIVLQHLYTSDTITDR